MLDRSQIEQTIMRVAYAAFTYYPGKAADLRGWSVAEDIDWCLEPLRSLSPGLRAGFAERIRMLITDPEQNRRQFIHDLNALESNASRWATEPDTFRALADDNLPAGTVEED